MPEFTITTLDDPRLDPFRDLKQPRSIPADTFIAEGEKLVERLLESSWQTESILGTEAALARFRSRIPTDVPIYVTTTPLISHLIGFQFHRGILACGRRPAPPSLESLCRRPARTTSAVLVLCPSLRDPANLGTIIRTAAAFGAVGVVVGHAGTDPFSRRVLRTSMGTVLRLPIVQTDDWPAVLDTLHKHEFETIATVLDDAAEPLDRARRPQRVAILLGNEDAGLPDELVRVCQRKVTLPMAEGVDSLNVAIAAGIVLYHFAGARSRPALD